MATYSGEANPMRVMELSSAYWDSRVIHAAHGLNVFTLVDEKPMNAEELGAKIGASPRGLDLLLIGCCSIGLLRRDENGRYSNTPLADTHLVEGRDMYQGGIVKMFDEWYGPWSGLQEAVTKGAPVVEKQHDHGPEATKAYIYGMHWRGVAQAKLLSRVLDGSGRKRMLDIAGGPGTFTLHMCLENPELSGTILDLPQTLEVTKEIIGHYQMTGRVEPKVGNYIDDQSFGENYDIALMSSMLNQESPETLKAILSKARAALNDGGMMIVQEQLLDDDKNGPRLPAVIGLNQLIHTPGGQNYCGAEIRQFMEEVGFKDVHYVDLGEESPFVVILGTK
ncbi:MAG: methyltransferase [Nitrospirota bacterium]|nr:methyltransferase [Nitrospirota bacterium]